jgi:hypothetical protein
MTANQFSIQVVEHLGNREVSVIGRHLGIKQHLKQQIAEFFGQVRPVAPLDGVEDLVGLLQRVFANGIEGLLAVPGAAAGSPQPSHDGHRLLKQSRRTLRIRIQVRRGSLCVTAVKRRVHAPSVYLAMRRRRYFASHGKESFDFERARL